MIEVVNVATKLAGFSSHWNPKIVAEVNGQHVKLVRLQGEFVWHAHEAEDELFLVLSGALHRCQVRHSRHFLVDCSPSLNDAETAPDPRGGWPLPCLQPVLVG